MALVPEDALAKRKRCYRIPPQKSPRANLSNSLLSQISKPQPSHAANNTVRR